MAVYETLCFERIPELRQRDLTAFEASPCIGIGVHAVYAPQEITRQPTGVFEAGEGDEGALGQDAAEIPQHGPIRAVWAAGLSHYFFFFL
jgi:hypothetical protein